MGVAEMIEEKGKDFKLEDVCIYIGEEVEENDDEDN